GELVQVFREHERPLAVDLDLSHPVAQPEEPITEPTLAEPEPCAEVVVRGRPVRAQVRGDDEGRRLVRVWDARPPRARGLGTSKRHSGPPVRSEADVALPGQGLQERPPPRPKRVA